MEDYDLDAMTTEEIKALISVGVLTEAYVRWYYNNECWSDTP
jgi:hypothetical protein